MKSKIYTLKIAELHNVNRDNLYLFEEGEKLIIDVDCFLVAHPKEGFILIDLGIINPIEYKKKYCIDAVQKNDWQLLNRLEALGIKLLDIKHILFTHLHTDHFNENIRLFPDAKIYISRKEVEWIAAPKIERGYDRLHAAMVVNELFSRINYIDEEMEIIPGIKVLNLPGHTYGSIGFNIKTAEGTVCIIGDCAFTYRNIEENVLLGWALDLGETVHSWEKVKKSSDIILPSHDPELFKRFKNGIIG